MNIDDYLADVERYGFNRDNFPIELNDHTLLLIHNDCRVIESDRLSVHFTLYCSDCHSSHTVRGHSPPHIGWSVRHIPDVKLIVLGSFLRKSCQP